MLKITTDFLFAMHKLLFSEGNDIWKEKPLERLKEIDQILSVSLEECFNSKVNDILSRKQNNHNKQIKNAQIHKKTKKKDITFDKEFLFQGLKSKYKKLEEEKQYIKECLAKSIYPICVEPFNDMGKFGENNNNAKLLLSTSYMFYLRNNSYNQHSLSALERMLKQNFNELLTDQIKEKLYINVDFNDTFSITDAIINKLSSAQDITLEDINYDPLLEENAEIFDQVSESFNIFKNNSEYVELSTITEIRDIFYYFASFYPDHKMIYGPTLLTLCQIFQDSESILEFCKRHIDFTSYETIEGLCDDLSNFWDMPNLRLLSKKNHNIWKKMIVEYGQDALKYFMNLGKLSDDSLEKLDMEQVELAENQLEFLKSTLCDLFVYKNASENENFAELCKQYQVSEYDFNKALNNILPHAKTYDHLPDISFKLKLKKENFTFEKLQPGDLNGLFLGKMTHCCQSLDGASSS